MATQQNEVNTKLTVNAGPAAAVLSMFRRSVGGVVGVLGQMGSHLSAAFGIGGVLGIGNAIRGVDELYSTISRLKKATGENAQSLHAVLDAFEKGGMGASDTEGIILQLYRSTRAAAGAISITGEKASDLAANFRAVGVSIKAGPEQQLIQMAEAAQRGRLGLEDLIRLFRIPPEKAASTLAMLKQGPDHLRKSMAEQKMGAASITEESLASFKAMQKARAEASSAFGDIVSIVYRTFFPAIATGLQTVRDKLVEWQPIAERVAKIMVDNMTTVVWLAEKYVKLLLLSKALTAVTGMGIGGNLKRAGAALSPAIDTKAGAKRVAAMGVASTMEVGLGMMGRGRGAIAATAGMGARARAGAVASTAVGLVQTLPARLVGFFTSLGSTFFPKGLAFLAATVKLGAVIGMLAKLSIVGVIVAVIVKAFQLVANNVDGIKDRLVRLLDKIVVSFQGVGSSLAPVLDALGVGLTYAAKGVLAIVEMILAFIAGILVLVKAIGIFVAMMVQSPSRITSPIETFKDALREAQADTAEKAHQREIERAKERAAATAKPTDKVDKAGVYQDFRGSKFDIKQEFAEGFDADRVAVVFGRDVAKLGERRVQSNLAPLYSVR